MSDRSGETIREYVLVEKVGEGEFASVYKARDIHLDRTIALKVIHPSHMTQRESMLRFKSEASMIAHLNHPFIVRLFTFWMDDDGAYIAMQWMPGGSLEQRLTPNVSLSPEHVNNILQKIAPALSAVHRQQIVHRDLKPANIMFDEEDNAYVADFGLAKWHQRPSGVSLPEASIGTPAYMPPEQVESNGEDVTGAADVYSLGVIIYELLTGQHPFGHDCGLVEMILHHLRDQLPLVGDHLPEISDAIDPIIQKATQKNPQDRFGDVLELADAFQEAIVDSEHSKSLPETVVLIRDEVVPPRGDVHAHVYRQSGAVLEKPRNLIGRDALLETIFTELSNDARILLHGLGGMGKTSIAATVAAQYLDAIEGEVIWIELGKQTEDTFFDAIANALGKQADIAGKRGDQRNLAIREMLLEVENLLLVIDNIWNEQAMIPIMRSIPHSVPTLLTSRKLLSIDGMLLDIEELADDDAMQLLQHHANKSYTSDDAALKLISMLGNHPYAIELAGSRLKIYRHITPDKLIGVIRDAPHDTGQLGQIKKPGVKDLLDESLSELDDHLRHVLTMMGGLFTTYASLELFSAVMGQDKDALIEDLAELERNGLIRLNFDNTELPHYRMHDLTYSYLYMAFTKVGQRRGIIEATRIYLRENVNNYDALELDLMNILGVARSAKRMADGESLIDIMRQLVVEAKYLSARGSSSIVLEMLNSAIDIAVDQKDFESAHYLTGRLGDANLHILAQYEIAVTAYTQSLLFAQKIFDLKREAILLSFVATARFKAGLDKVEWHYDEAMRVAQESGDISTVVVVLLHRSFHSMYLDTPDFEVGRSLSDEAIRILLEHGIRNETLLSAMNNRAVCEEELGHLEDAIETYRQAYSLAKEIDDHMWIARLSDNLGCANHALGNRDTATQFFCIALSYADQLGYEELSSEILTFASQHHYDLSEDVSIEIDN